ncbi:ABC transporter substrate-binding protein [Anaeromyxobacter oryzae]|uniref:ABC transporter-binding protein n=1 Tax=Anaeromyxobacter oryzae TaxID=2918170 RepID=A0ABN6MWX7_9BACT|nr:ABC transporter substrate-binding protein [Anaeromyxobacter oryzae]BDG05464.1 putative ABC transporter-binding protein [Anaeromyxobacter oryzae]
MLARRLALLVHALLVPGLAAGVLSAGTASAQGGATVSIACGSVGVEFDLCKSGAEAWAKKTGNQVRVVSTPKESNEILAQYQQLLSSKSGDIDVLRIDVVWPGLLAQHLADLSQAVPKDVIGQHFPAIIQANTVGGKLVALPWFTDAGLLYYRKDLLEKYGRKVPATWQELTETAKLVQDGERKAGNASMWGFVFQGRAYEGLTCNALEWVDSFGGGQIVDPKGKVTIDNPKAAQALTLAASWIRTISPEGVLNYAEEEARGGFQSGNAVFMRNWPYAWALSQAADSPVKGKVGVAPLPKGGPDGKHTGTLGGWQLAVNKYSKNQKAAIDLAMWLTGPEEQKRAALTASLNPTRPALYKDEEILKANPFFGELLDTFTSAVARPSRVTGAKYNQVSSEFWNAVHETLTGRSKAQDSLARLSKGLDRLSRGGKW